MDSQKGLFILSPSVFQVFEDMVCLKLPQLPQDALAGQDSDAMATGATHLDVNVCTNVTSRFS